MKGQKDKKILEKKEQEDTSIEVDAPENADTPENNEGDKQQVKDNESDAEGDSTTRDEHPNKVEDTRPDDGHVRRERVRIDNGGDGIGRVVEAVDRFVEQNKTQSKQK